MFSETGPTAGIGCSKSVACSLAAVLRTVASMRASCDRRVTTTGMRGMPPWKARMMS
jgi:hypothetical protein